MKHPLKYIIILMIAFSTSFGFEKLYAADDDAKAKEEVKVTDATLKLTFDTTGGKHVIATIMAKDPTGAIVPVKGVTVAILIKKSFGMLPVEGDNMVTDDAGTVSVNFPKDMPGDRAGIVNISSKVDADPKVGDLEAESTVNWGTITVPENFLNKRALWAARANAPISLVVAANLIIALVWGTILYIVFKLITINKLGKNENAIETKN